MADERDVEPGEVDLVLGERRHEALLVPVPEVVEINDEVPQVTDRGQPVSRSRTERLATLDPRHVAAPPSKEAGRRTQTHA
jgi:hypothetical protein